MTESELSYRVEFPLLSVGPTKFKQVTAETSTPPYTLLGVKLLGYGKVTIDYPRRRWYFEAYEQEFDLAGKYYNVKFASERRGFGCRNGMVSHEGCC